MISRYTGLFLTTLAYATTATAAGYDPTLPENQPLNPAPSTSDLWPGQPGSAKGPVGSFGNDTQDYWISASQFKPRDESTALAYEDNDYWASTGFNNAQYQAQVELPAGAHITDIFQCYVNDTSADGNWNFSLYESQYDLATESPNVSIFAHVSYPDGGGGFIRPSVSVNHTVKYRDGSNRNMYHILATAEVSSSSLTFRGCRLLWDRQISPAPATATFNDVGTGHIFFQHVEALADSGITAGCGGGNFCPDSPLTRGQMAVFLAAALGLHWPY